MFNDTTPRRSRLFTPVLLATVGLVTACSQACGGAETPPATAPTPSPTATTAPAPTGTSEPKKAENPTPALAAAPAAMTMSTALAGDWRKADEKARDGARHPQETLEFFGLTNSMTVVELSPGGGWYTSILAPFLRDNGKLFVVGGDPNGPANSEGTRHAKTLADRFSTRTDVFGKVGNVVVPEKGKWNLGAPGSADMVVTFRNLHNWVADGSADQALDAVNKVLKTGGVFGLTDHRAKPDAKTDVKTIDNTGYIPEAFVIKLVESHGFTLAGKSEINANPKDTKDYAKGVWTLPPSLQLKDKDRAKYQAIGESDRMTLKFVKK